MRMSLGAIAKGFIVDRALEHLRMPGVEGALVEAGGDTVHGTMVVRREDPAYPGRRETEDGKRSPTHPGGG